MEARTAQAKYVFLDVVAFTQNRSVEAQSKIISVLNELVLAAVHARNVPEDKLLLIPTGDGICIATLNYDEPFDVHMLLALDVLKQIRLQRQNR